MTTLYAIAPALGLTGLFAARIFLPAFAAAVVLRFGPEYAWLTDLGLLAPIANGAPPTWFTDDLTLMVLGTLAAIELIAHRSAGARELLVQVDHYAKPMAAVLTFFGVFSIRDLAFIESVAAGANVWAYGLALLVLGGTFVVARAHNNVLGGIIEMDEDDDTGVMGYFAWAQDLGSVFGVFLFLLFPILVLVLVGIGIGLVFLLRKRAESREARAKIACAACGESMYWSALACPACGVANPAPTTVNWLGVATGIPVLDLERQPLELVAKKRCRRCATRLTQRTPAQACTACGTAPFDEPAFLAAYDRFIGDRLSSVLLVCLFLSFVPLVGLIVGIIYYRLELVAPFRRYVGRGRSLLLRIAVKILFFFLIFLQLVPMLGALVVPLMGWISYRVFRRAFFGSVRKTLAPAPVA